MPNDEVRIGNHPVPNAAMAFGTFRLNTSKGVKTANKKVFRVAYVAFLKVSWVFYLYIGIESVIVMQPHRERFSVLSVASP